LKNIFEQAKLHWHPLYKSGFNMASAEAMADEVACLWQ
jgi:hypothetical protein